MQVSRQVCRGLLANIIFTGQMFSAGGKRNNKYAGTPHFHDWSVASTKSTALFRVCTHILPAWSVAEGHPGSMQKCVCVCVCVCVCGCVSGTYGQTPTGLSLNSKNASSSRKHSYGASARSDEPFWYLQLPTQFSGRPCKKGEASIVEIHRVDFGFQCPCLRTNALGKCTSLF